MTWGRHFGSSVKEGMKKGLPTRLRHLPSASSDLNRLLNDFALLHSSLIITNTVMVIVWTSNANGLVEGVVR